MGWAPQGFEFFVVPFRLLFMAPAAAVSTAANDRLPLRMRAVHSRQLQAAMALAQDLPERPAVW
jgi:hypothetical protein